MGAALQIRSGKATPLWPGGSPPQSDLLVKHWTHRSMSRDERLDDAELMLALSSGDKRALATLYDRHAPMALGLATRILRDSREAEDLVHDVFLELWRRSSTYRPEAASVRTWLLLIVRSRCFDRRGSSARRLTVALSGADDFEAISSNDDTSPDRARVPPLLEMLPTHQREVIVLGYYEGLSSSEIAERLSVPVGTVKSRVAAALATLRESLSPPTLLPVEPSVEGSSKRSSS